MTSVSKKKYPELEGKTFYKITDVTGYDPGFQYNDGLNAVKESLDKTSWHWFSLIDIHHILQFINHNCHSCYLRIVELPLSDPDFKYIKDGNNKWRSNRIILKDRMDLKDTSTFEYLIEKGIDIDSAMICASKAGYLEVVKYLVEKELT